MFWYTVHATTVVLVFIWGGGGGGGGVVLPFMACYRYVYVYVFGSKTGYRFAGN